jgi:hypothetical protein
MDDARPVTRLGEIGNEETFAESLQRKERELIQRISAVRGALAPLEHQLEQVRKAMTAIGLTTGQDVLGMLRSAAPTTDGFTVTTFPDLPQTNHNALFGLAALGASKDHPLTIKQMIVYGLRDHFHNGASPVELRDYLHTAYGREVDRNSISPQLARLREEGRVEQNALISDGKWRLTALGRMYDHPRSIEKDD